MVTQGEFLHELPQVIDGIDVEVCQIKALDVGLGGSKFDQSGMLGPPPSVKR